MSALVSLDAMMQAWEPSTPRRLHIDYETRGVVDLPSQGVAVYVEHPHTEAIVLSWAIDDEPFQIWWILRGDPIPPKLEQALLDPNVTIVAHNAPFEWAMSIVVGRRQGFLSDAVRIAIHNLDRWSCTAARAAACGLPRALEKVCQALNLEHRKDMEGHKLMMEMCRPVGIDAEGRYIWLEDHHRMVRLGQYALGDGYAEREVDTYLPPLSEFEHEVWACSERMNMRGIAVDTQLLAKLSAAVADATRFLNAKLIRLTNGQVEKVTQPQRIVAWLKTYGVDTENNKIGRWIIQGLLEDPDIPEIVREVLVIRRDGGKSSTSKFKTIEKRLNLDFRVRAYLMFCGAAGTGRYSSRGLQLQNLPRGKIVKDVMKAIEAVLSDMPIAEIEKQFGPAMIVFSELTRPILIAKPDCWLARGDYSQIEARVNPWLANEQTKLDGFRAYDRGEGPDNYIVVATKMFKVAEGAIDKDDPRRQSGKVTDLACGFGGGYKALLAMAKIYNMKLTEGEAQTSVEMWREAHPATKQFWYNAENAAVACMRSRPGILFPVGPTNLIAFKRNDTCLAMILPSGRRLLYWYARLEDKETPWGELRPTVTYYGEDVQTHHWRRFSTYGGFWMQNGTQAIARDVMAYALVTMERRGLPPVLTVHDEGVAELLKRLFPKARDAAQAVLDAMLALPSWAVGLPVAAEASADQRYTKGSKENTVTGFTEKLYV
jgi:DNA polymerase